MHLYYYLKEDAYYVMDCDHKFYRYPKKNNLIPILYLENGLHEIEAMKNEEEIFPFKTIEEWTGATWLTVTNIIQMITVLENIYLNDSSFSLYGIEAIISHFAYHKYSDFKKKRIQSNEFYEKLLEEEQTLVKEKIQHLKSIIDYSKEEISLSEFDVAMEKHYFDDESFIEPFITNAIDNMFVNVYPEKVFYDPSFLDYFWSEETWLEFEDFMKLADEFKTVFPERVNQKIKYLKLLKEKDFSYFLGHLFLLLPFLKSFIGQIKETNIPDILVIYSFYIFTALFYILRYRNYSRVLTMTENPTLKRKIHL